MQYNHYMYAPRSVDVSKIRAFCLKDQTKNFSVTKGLVNLSQPSDLRGWRETKVFALKTYNFAILEIAIVQFCSRFVPFYLYLVKNEQPFRDKRLSLFSGTNMPFSEKGCSFLCKRLSLFWKTNSRLLSLTPARISGCRCKQRPTPHRYQVSVAI